VLIPVKVSDDSSGDEIWVIHNTTTGDIDLGLRFSDMVHANLYAVEDPSYRWAILASEIGVG
jgi:hypothetical protein